MEDFEYTIDAILTWSRNFDLADMTVRTAENNNDPPTIVAPTGLEFQITYSNVYAPVVNFLAENNKKLLEQLKS